MTVRADRACATWNIQSIRGASAEKIRRIVDAIARHQPGVVALQEVRIGETADRVIEAVAGIGLDRAYFSGTLADREMPRPKNYGNVLASRWPIGPITRPVPATRPQLTAAATIDLSHRRVLVVNTHIPNGSGNGWEKVYALEALATGLNSIELPTVLAGDFNEPRTFTSVFASFRADELGQTEGDTGTCSAPPPPTAMAERRGHRPRATPGGPPGKVGGRPRRHTCMTPYMYEVRARYPRLV